MQKFFTNKYFHYFLLSALIPLLFIFSPKPENEKLCSSYIQISSFAGVMISCDSFDFAEPAKSPAKLLAKNHPRQSRPAYIFAASAIGYPISLVTSLIPMSAGLESRLHRLPPKTVINPNEKLSLYSYFFAYIILNILFLFLSIILLDKIIRIVGDGTLPHWVSYVFATFIVANFVVKAYVFSAHQQMMTIFSPLLCCYLMLKMVLAENLDNKKVFLIALVGGVLSLGYGNFFVLLPILIFAVAYHLLYKRLRLAKFFIVSIIISIIFVAPLLIWMAIVISQTGNFYSHEVVAYRQFVWIFDSLKAGFPVFWETFLANLAIYFSQMTFFLPFVYFGIVFVIVNNLYKKDEPKISNFYLKRNAILLVAILFVAFNIALGYYQPRLSFTVLTIIFILIALYLASLHKRVALLNNGWSKVTLLIIPIIWVIYNVTSYGPFE